jgi:hypothetical protein
MYRLCRCYELVENLTLVNNLGAAREKPLLHRLAIYVLIVYHSYSPSPAPICTLSQIQFPFTQAQIVPALYLYSTRQAYEISNKELFHQTWIKNV